LKNGEEIAVKRLTRTSKDERKEKEFLTEIGTIGHVRHSNVLSLRGCCIDNGLYFVFELSTTGSVSSILHGNYIKTFSLFLTLEIDFLVTKLDLRKRVVNSI
jgi:serine/threonine protein kinase